MDVLSLGKLSVASRAWRSDHGGCSLTVVCKATFQLQPDRSPLAPAQEPVVEADVYAHTGRGSLAHASELAPFKQWPEVLVVGHAYAPDGHAVPSLTARVVVGPIDKSVQVDGDRYFDEDGWISDPEPFTRMPLTWERAAGGPGTLNPAGIALGPDARPDAHGRVPAPNFLPPGLFLTSRRKVVPPVGLGPIAPRWPSRVSFLQRHAADFDPDHFPDRPLPADIDAAYFNVAPADQQRRDPFGEESIYLENLHPRHPQLTTRLPSVTPTATVEQGGAPRPLRLRCDTLVIDTDRRLAMLVWRAKIMLDRPDAPGRVVVTGPGAGEAHAAPPPSARAVPAFSRKVTMDVDQLRRAKAVLPFMGKTASVDPDQVRPKDAALPFQDQGARAQSLGSGFTLGRMSAPPPTEESAAPAALPFGPPRADTAPSPDGGGAPAALPFGPRRADTVLAPEGSGAPAGLPFGPPRADTAPSPERAGPPSALPFGPGRPESPPSFRPGGPASRDLRPPPPSRDDGEHTLTAFALPVAALPWSRSPDSAEDDAQQAPTPPRGIPAVSAPREARPPTFGLPPDPAPPTFSPPELAPPTFPPPVAPPPPTFGLPPDPPQSVFGRPSETGLPTFSPAPEHNPLSFSPAPEHSPLAFAPAHEPTPPPFTPPPFTPATDTPAPAPVFSLIHAPAAPDPAAADPQVARIRLVQQAIWKGDRPARQVLAEHGLTEIEWRALKRAAARKAAAERAGQRPA